MADQQVLFQALSEFAEKLVGRYVVTDVLVQLGDHLVRSLELAAAGVSLGDEDGLLRFATAVPAHVTDVEEIQELEQGGPCVNTYKTGKPTRSPDLADEDRWPREYVERALAAGLRAVVSIPMRFEDRTLGSIDLYSNEPRWWSDDDIATATVFANIATSYLVHASRLEQSERIREQLQHALDSRVVIEQAKGIIARDLNISVDQAWQRLRSHARSRSANLHDVAAAVVNLGLRIEP
jgi:GAF domain-containing protein